VRVDLSCDNRCLRLLGTVHDVELASGAYGR
jgi:hypothetical protein